ncbi:ABC transporter permease [Ochrovirga pacifica]|uniref:ABC transporter permease n=1 Tax=Ochrovirga pacifica TaxID=1042376 RepID=UPI000255775D|nr:ABC transporter permease [Ochrovirga pacifica]
MHKLLLIIRREFITKVRSKSYLVMIFLSPVLILSMFAAVFYFVAKEKRNNDSKTSLIVMTSDAIQQEITKQHPKISLTTIDSLSYDAAKLLVDEETYNGIVYTRPTKNVYEIYGDEIPKASLKKILEKHWKTNYLEQHQIPKNVAAPLLKESPVKVLQAQNTHKKVEKYVKGTIAIGLGYIMMMFVIVYGNAVMRSIIEEKNSKVVEIMVCSVQPFLLMLGKIIGNALAGLLQFIIWGVLLLLGLFFMEQYVPSQGDNSQKVALIFNTIWQINYLQIVWVFIAFFLSGYLLYSSFYASIGAAVDSETDTQQFVHPILLPLMFAVYIGIVVVINGDPHSETAKLFTLIPFTSPIILPMRIPFDVPTWEIFTSLALLLVSFVCTVFIASKIYRIGILTDGNKPSIKQLFQWIFQKI